MNFSKKMKQAKSKLFKLFGVKYSYHKNSTIEDLKIKFHQDTNKNLFKFNILRNMIIDMNNDILQKKYIIQWRFMLHGNSYFPNIDNPKTFNEKIQWMNLYYHNPKITECTDKVSFKEYLRREIGEEYIIPTYGVYDNASQINLAELPEEFVLKSNWGGGTANKLLYTIKTVNYQMKECYLLQIHG